MKNFLLYIWQLPQNLLGLLVIFFSLANHVYMNGVVTPFYFTKYSFGVSLGCYIIVNENCSQNTLLHKLGHCYQSLYLGWLYLPVIGLPSAIGNLLHRFIKFDYYKQPWEKWADELGGVER